MNVAADGGFLQKAGGNQVGIEVFQAGQNPGNRRTGLSLRTQVAQVVADIQLGGAQNVRFPAALQPFGKLPDVPQVGADRVGGRLFYLGQVSFIGMNQVQHESAYPYVLSIHLSIAPKKAKSSDNLCSRSADKG